LTDTPDGAWHLVYDTKRKELYIDSQTSLGTERLAIDTALKLEGDGPSELHLAIIDLFRA
jgi:hypothetical protein